MAKQYTLLRKIGTVPVTAGGFATIDLPRDHDYNTIGMRLSGNAQVTTNCTAVRAEAPVQWVPRVQLIAEGKNMLHNSPFWATVLGMFRRKSIQSGGRSILAPTAATVATYPVEALGFIDFNVTDTVRPKDAAFRSYGLSLLQLQFQFGQPIDIFVPGAGVVVFSGIPTVEVWAANCVEDRNADGTYAGTPPLFLKKTTFQELAIVNANSSQEIRLPAGNLLRSVLIRTEGAVTAGEPSITNLNNLILQNSNDVRLNLTGPQIRQKNNGDYGQITAGYYVGDLVAKGGEGNNTLSDLWDVGGASEPKAILDVNAFAAGKAQAIIEEYIQSA
jgi:hypothetical protein